MSLFSDFVITPLYGLYIFPVVFIFIGMGILFASQNTQNIRDKIIREEEELRDAQLNIF